VRGCDEKCEAESKSKADFVLTIKDSLISLSAKDGSLKQVVPTKQCRSIISISYISQLLAARGVKSGVYKARQGDITKPALLCRDYLKTDCRRDRS